ncbi:uncharacterized protein C21orf58 isoform X1 [Channa argus]|uniref:uncharacterized protein C21orf58 isoform X1 n=1 Tax=Channa argus TaxID=215402 RepID=UPI0035202412
MIRLKLQLLEKKLGNKKHNMDNRAESAQSAMSYDGHMEAMHRALTRKQALLQRLRVGTKSFSLCSKIIHIYLSICYRTSPRNRSIQKMSEIFLLHLSPISMQEQHMLENLNRPHTWGGSQRQYQPHFITAPQLPPRLPPMAPNNIHHSDPLLPYLPLPPPAMPQPPRIIQQTLPQQPTTIIQQLPQQQPLITQIPPPQPYPAPRSSSIKEDMVELMLIQNAQMHQIIMHNMMLKAMPPMSVSPPGGPSHYATHSSCLGQVGTHLVCHKQAQIKHKVSTFTKSSLKSVLFGPGLLPGKPYFCKARYETKR